MHSPAGLHRTKNGSKKNYGDVSCSVTLFSNQLRVLMMSATISFVFIPSL